MSRRKKIGSQGKTDEVMLFNIDENREQGQQENIPAGTRFLVTRRPPEAAIKQQTANVGGSTQEIVELTYNPKQVQMARQSQKQPLLENEPDYVEPEEDSQQISMVSQEDRVQFKTVKIDASIVEVEFMC